MYIFKFKLNNAYYLQFQNFILFYMAQVWSPDLKLYERSDLDLELNFLDVQHCHLLTQFENSIIYLNFHSYGF